MATRERFEEPWPSRRPGDDGKYPEAYGHVIRSKWSYPCFRCGKTIPAGALVGGNLATGTIHGDPNECAFFRRRKRRTIPQP
jgi:hypothetical protein